MYGHKPEFNEWFNIVINYYGVPQYDNDYGRNYSTDALTTILIWKLE